MKEELLRAAHDGFFGAIYLYVALFLAILTGPFRLLARIGEEWLQGKPMHFTRTKTIKPN